MKTYAIIIGCAFAIVLGVQAFTAEGAPSNPTMQLQSALTPSVGQTANVVVQSQVYSVQPPNSIDLLGAKVVYSAWQNGIQVALTQSQALGVTGGTGSLYTFTATLPVVLGAVCSGTGCGGFAENLTVTATVVVSTYDGVYASNPVTVTFLSNGQGSLMPFFGPTSQAPANPAFYNFNLWGSLTAAAAIELWVFAVALRQWPLALPAAGVTIMVFAMFLLWG